MLSKWTYNFIFWQYTFLEECMCDVSFSFQILIPLKAGMNAAVLPTSSREVWTCMNVLNTLWQIPGFPRNFGSMFTSTTLYRQQGTVSHPCADQLALSFTFNSQLQHISHVCLKYAPIFFPYWKKRKLSHDFLRISGEANLTKPSVSQLLFALSKIWRGFKRNFFKFSNLYENPAN